MSTGPLTQEQLGKVFTVAAYGHNLDAAFQAAASLGMLLAADICAEMMKDAKQSWKNPGECAAAIRERARK
jgi:hypothetical protein